MSRQGVHARVSPEGSLEILSSKEVNQLKDDGEGETQMNQLLIDCWATLAGDPDTEVARWLREGAPAGIDAHSVRKDIFPPPGPDDLILLTLSIVTKLM